MKIINHSSINIEEIDVEGFVLDTTGYPFLTEDTEIIIEELQDAALEALEIDPNSLAAQVEEEKDA